MNIHNLKEQNVRNVLIDAVRRGMEIVSRDQGGHTSRADIKPADGTVVTPTDKQSEKAMKIYLRNRFGDRLRIKGEELGQDHGGEDDITILLDPLDGTRSFANGLMTSTVILAGYDETRKQVVFSIVGEPVSGRLWYAFLDEQTMLISPKTGNLVPCKVFDHEISDQMTVFLDVSHGFTREGQHVLTDHQVADVFKELGYRVKLFLPGSNGLQQALVANGGQKVVGSITTAIGGPWDVCGVKLVLNAGGAAQAFVAVETGDLHPARCFVKHDPLDVTNYDFLVCGNSLATINTLIEWMPVPFAT